MSGYYRTCTPEYRAAMSRNAPKEPTMATPPILDAEDVRALLKTTVRASVREAFAAERKPEPVSIIVKKPRRPSLWRAIRAASSGSWTGAELERDLSQAAQSLFAWKEADDSSHNLYLARDAGEYVRVLDAAHVETPNSPAIKALTEGTGMTWTIGTGGGGPLGRMQLLGGEFSLAMIARPVLRSMPEVTIAPIQAAVVEAPRESIAGQTVEIAEGSAITPADLTSGLTAVNIARPARMMLVSAEVMADVGQPGSDVLLQRMMSAEILSFTDAQELAGSGVLPNIRGLRNAANLTTSSWVAAANGSTPGGDDVLAMIADIFTANAHPTALVMHPRTAFRLAALKDTTGAYLFPQLFAGLYGNGAPDYTQPRFAGTIFGVGVWVSTSVPINETQGTSSTATTIIYGDFRQIYILERQGVELFASPHQYLNTDQVAVRATVREAVVAANPAGLSVASGII